MIAASWLAEITQRLAARGFNLVGVADARRFDAGAPAGRRLSGILPGGRAAVVIASGGRAVWEAATGVSAQVRGRPLPPTGDPDPIDTFTDMTVSAEAALFAAAFPQARLRILYPFGEHASTVSFTRLAEEAGLGTVDTVLRLLLHPLYGPWVSLRACLLTDLDLPAAGQLEGFRPCDGCPRPCLGARPTNGHLLRQRAASPGAASRNSRSSAETTPSGLAPCPRRASRVSRRCHYSDGLLVVCPAGVLTAGGWDHAACFTYRRAGPNCLDGCAPRLACPVGAEHRYGPAEMRHRQLAAMREE